MHHHRVEADQLHQHDVAGEPVFQMLVFHGVAAVLDHDGFAGETADVGQRFGENMRHLGGGLGI
jgi:hypothetical protein